jgi:hypothetical protein
MGIRYVLYENTLNNYGNDYRAIKSKDDISVEENTDALPMFYITDQQTKGLKFDNQDKENPFPSQSRVISSMLGLGTELNGTENYFSKLPEENVSEPVLKNCTAEQRGEGYTGYNKTDTAKDTTLTFTVTAANSEEIFLWLPVPTTSYRRKVNIWVRRGTKPQTFMGVLMDGDNYRPIELGRFEPGEEFTLIVTMLDDTLFYKDFGLYTIDRDKYQPAINAIHEMNANTTMTMKSKSDFTVKTDSAKASLLWTSISYERGWSVTVDGKKLDLTSKNPDIKPIWNDTLLAVPLTAGAHTVRLSFAPAYYPQAIFISVFGLSLFGLLCAICAPNNPKRKDPLDADGDDDDDSDIPEPDTDNDDNSTDDADTTDTADTAETTDETVTETVIETVVTDTVITDTETGETLAEEVITETEIVEPVTDTPDEPVAEETPVSEEETPVSESVSDEDKPVVSLKKKQNNPITKDYPKPSGKSKKTKKDKK